MAIHASGEDYLETIFLIGEEHKDVHSVEVARRMGVAKPTVTKAVKNLVQDGYLTLEGVHLRLTARGEEYAREVYAKHQLLTEFWVLHGVDRATAEKDACRMEHGISDEVISAIKKYVEEKGKEA